MRISIDLETKSSVDLQASGVYRYVEEADFDILLMAYSIDDQPTRLIDLTTQDIPKDLLEAILDPTCLKKAFNAQFERVCLSEWLKRKHSTLLKEGYLNPKGWRCTKVQAAAAGIVGNLSQVAKAFKCPHQKDIRGARLIRMFCMPPFVNPKDKPIEWEQFKEYCKGDVNVEKDIDKATSPWALSEEEWCAYELDQTINDRGILIDTRLCEQAMRMADTHKGDATEELAKLTGLTNPNSRNQIYEWLKEQAEITIENMRKETLERLLEDNTLPDNVVGVLELRLGSNQASTKKYKAALDRVNKDGRARGTLQFYGSHTGRFAGKGIQLQNLFRNHLEPLEALRTIVKVGDEEALDMLDLPTGLVLKNLVRTMLIAKEGHTFAIADFSSIEARILAWLAEEHWVIDAFAKGEDLYSITAAKMKNKPLDQVTKDDRQAGKTAILACGYGGGVNALKAMAANYKLKFSDAQASQIVKQYRTANRRIVEFWSKCEAAAVNAAEGLPTKVGKVKFAKKQGALTITLPTGRQLVYQQIRHTPHQGLTYLGVYKSGIARLDTYGGKLCENITQAIARDILVEGLKRLECYGYATIQHTHDEVIVEHPIDDKAHLRGICEALLEPIEWADGLPLDAEGTTTPIYKKT